MIKVSYNLSNIDQGLYERYKVESDKIVEEGSTTYYWFVLSDGETSINLHKRFDQFRMLDEEMRQELLEMSHQKTPGRQASFHILPVLPDIDIDSVRLNY